MLNILKRHKFLTLLVLIILTLIIVIGIKSFLFKKTHRLPNEYESMYLAIGTWSANPEICAKISSKAWYPPGIDDRDGRYYRSDCFFEVAAKTKNKSLCDEVKASLKHNSQEECQKEVSTSHFYGGTGYAQMFDSSNQALILKAMGYDDKAIKDLTIASGTQPDFPNFIKTQGFKSKIYLLPDFSK